MKKQLLLLTLTAVLASCGAQPGKSSSAAKAAPKTGGALIASENCSTCHKVDVKLVGPSFKDIANKYTLADSDKLAGKIINGGSGVWGDIPMTSHPDISEADAKAMVKYILAQK